MYPEKGKYCLIAKMVMSGMFIRLKWCIPCFLFLSVIYDGAEGGIAGLTKFFRTKFSDCWITVSPPLDPLEPAPYQVDNLCIDMNQVLHTGLRLALSGNTKHFMSKVFKDLDNILRVAQPTKALVLAFDGPAPFAKIQTQRSRRTNSPENSIITPGTTLMNKIESIMICYVLQRLRRKQFRDLSVFISGPSCPGEGELKIVEWINSHMVPPPFVSGKNSTEGRGKKGSSGWCEESLIICGSDSDILLQALSLSHVNPYKTLIMQSSRGQGAIPGSTTERGKCSGGGMSAAPSSFCNVSQIIQNLRMYTGIEVPLGGEEISASATNLTVPESFNLDMVVLFVLQGNDYLPKMRGATIARTAGAYGRALRRLPPHERHLLDLESNTFNFPALWALMDELLRPSSNCGQQNLQPENVDAFDDNESSYAASSYSSPSLVPLPVPMTTAMQTLHTYLQRRKIVESEWDDFHKMVGADGNWGTRIVINEQEFSCPAIYSNKKQARQEVATEALHTLAPDLFEEMIRKQHHASEKLAAMRRRVELELEDWRKQEEAEGNFTETNVGYQGPNMNFSEFSKQIFDKDEDQLRINDDALYVTETEYLSYVRGSDTQAYLNGIMWVVQMYVDGVCPDLSFTFLDRPPASALTIKSYVEQEYLRARRQHQKLNKSANSGNSDDVTPLVLEDLLSSSKKVDTGSYQDNAVKNLRADVCIPYSRTRPLTSSAACACVIPYSEESEKHVPPELHGIWKVMQEEISKINKDCDDDDVSSFADLRMDSEGAESFASYADLISQLKVAFEDEQNKSDPKKARDSIWHVTCGAKESVWTVISPTSYCSSRSFTENANSKNKKGRPTRFPKSFKPHAYLTLADVAHTLNNTFHVPSKMPLGHKLAMTTQLIHSRKNRLRLYLRNKKRSGRANEDMKAKMF